MKRNFVKIALLGMAMLCSVDFASAQSEKANVIQLLSHRGGRFEFDENTMYAFRESYKAGVRGYETDIRMTKDGSLILSHDESLYRTCGVDLHTEDLTDAECRKIRTKEGNPLAFCRELVDFLADKEGMYVEFEIKTVKELYTQAMLDELCDKLYKMAMAKKPASSEYVFSSFDKRALQTMQRLHPDATLMMLKGKPCSPEVLMEAYDMGIKRVACRMDGTTRQTVALGHKLGMFISLWPVNTKEDILLGIALGSDALCCDRFVETSDWLKEQLPANMTKGIAR